MTSNDSLLITKAKQAAGHAAANLIQEGMLVGLGSGSTASYFIQSLGERCKKGLKISAVATSYHSMREAQAAGIVLENDQAISVLDLTVDGADEIDNHKNMIKGGGGALLREKILAYSSREMIVIIDESKLVNHLGSFPVPIEIAPFAYRTTLLRLESKGYQGKLRLTRDNKIYLTDNGNYIFDIEFKHSILDPQIEHERLSCLIGVLETGLFFQVAGRVVIGYPDGCVKIRS
jgi:ribose 5-phosphate isomerase A